MKTSRHALLLATALAALASCGKKAPVAEDPAAAAAVAQALASIVATCGSASGEVQVKRTGQAAWEPVATGTTFRPGDEIRTGPLAFARVEFLSGGALELQERASVVIDVAPPAQGTPGGAAPEARVAVTEGEVRGFLPQAGAGANAAGLVIRAADGSETRLAAAPGDVPATFRVTRGKKGTEVAMTAGEARMGAGSAQKALKRGQAVELTGGAVSAPVELIDFPPSVEPGVDARFHFKPGISIRMTWRPVSGASGYRVQVGHDLAFQAIDAVKELKDTEFAFAPKGPGMHSWRVAARDASGRYGEYGFARRFYTEKEPPRDLLIGPEDGAALVFTDEAPPVTFSWESAGAADSYRLVVANGPDLVANKIISMVSEGQRVQLEGLAPGELYWGVYVDDDRTPEPIFVKPRRLSLQRVERPKVKVPKALSDWGK
jgi:predicted small lipoprotein YifL